MPTSNPSKKRIFLNLLNGQVANEMNSNKVILVAVVPRRSGIGSKNVVPWRINVGQHNIHFITGKRNPGAGSQCGYPSFCPTFVLCLAFVQHTSNICLCFVLVKHLSNICPKNPTFVLSKSNLCPLFPTYVLFLSS